MNDDELKKHFDALRATDQESAPSFPIGKTASLHALSTRNAKTKVPVWPWALGGLTLTASVPVALIAYLAIQPSADHVPPARVQIPRVELADPEPLAFLLRPIPALEQAP